MINQFLLNIVDMKTRTQLSTGNRLVRASALRDEGFTLVELLISMATLLIIMGAVFVVFTHQTQVSTSEQGMIDMELNVRVAMDRIRFLVEHAGYGSLDALKNGRTMSGTDPDSGSSVTVNRMVWGVVDNMPTVSSDQVVLVTAYKKVAEVNGNYNSTGTNIDFKNLGSPTISSSTSAFKNYIAFFPNVEGDQFYQVTDASDPFDLDRSVDVIYDNAEVWMVAPIRIKEVNGTLSLQNFAYATSQYWEVAGNIENLQFLYTTDGSTWTSTVSNGNDVLGVWCFILAKAEPIESGYVNDNIYTLAGQSVGPFNDGHRRIVINEKIWIRNAG